MFWFTMISYKPVTHNYFKLSYIHTTKANQKTKAAGWEEEFLFVQDD